MISLESLDLPAVISTDDIAGWTKTKAATWPQLVRCLHAQRRALKAMEAEVEAFDEALVVLRPIMTKHPTMCVAEAFAVLNAQVSA